MKNTIYLFLLALAFNSCGFPIPQFVADSQSVVAAETVSFTNTSEKAESYRWDFGDGNYSTETEPSHRYFKSGTYEVTLMAVDESGKKMKTQTQNITVTPPKECLVRIETPEGNMLARLSDQTPNHQDNFVKLVEQDYYDSLLFHRVIEGFMIQGGDPNSKNAGPNARLGSGGPGYTQPAEFREGLAHVKGAIAAARTNNPQKASSGAQFYIVHGRPVTESELARQEAKTGVSYPSDVREAYLRDGGVPFLDQEYTVFGQVIEGMDVIDRIATTETGGADRPREDMWMKITLVR